MISSESPPADIARILSHSRLFYGMPPASLLDLVAHSHIEEIPAGRESFRELPTNELRIVLDGDLRVVAEGTTLGRGNFLGEAILLELALSHDLHSIRVQSREGCTCLVIHSHAIYAWMERHPQLQAALFQHLSQELFNREAG